MTLSQAEQDPVCTGGSCFTVCHLLCGWDQSRASVHLNMHVFLCCGREPEITQRDQDATLFLCNHSHTHCVASHSFSLKNNHSLHKFTIIHALLFVPILEILKMFIQHFEKKATCFCLYCIINNFRKPILLLNHAGTSIFVTWEFSFV